ncbi:hypothetical protein PHMEG_00024935 [Phytophthora megakarya]|uniref:Uncharacterized protein n=1 Tax=Phytophthora megakarya TaxID=4795 RepID=A0A225VFS6_9STRA|nr:hypothetical protein PHMEG_00024935 [Phytophthora megakarya]
MQMYLRYRQTREAANQRTGFGLEEDEIAVNMTIKDKLNEMCPEYERMEELFGERLNIQPASTLELGLPPQAQLHGDQAHYTASLDSRTHEQCDEDSGSESSRISGQCYPDGPDGQSHQSAEMDGEAAVQQRSVVASTEREYILPSQTKWRRHGG